MRFTKENRKKVLEQNDGFSTETSFSSRNNSFVRKYSIKLGKLFIREQGKGSWADSRYDKKWEASKDEELSFLRKFKNKLKL